MLTCIEAPQQRIIDRTALKQHLRVTTTADDARIDALLLAAESYLDGGAGILGRALQPQTWQFSLSNWPANRLVHLPLPPTIAVISVDYLDEAGTLQTLSAASWRQVKGGINGDLVVFEDDATLPAVDYDEPDAVRITYTCGYDSSASPGYDSIPEVVIYAAVLIVRAWYDNEPEIPNSARDMLAPFRVARASIGSDKNYAT
jgi:uncharacterized phiE125 gp8 family phage protein